MKFSKHIYIPILTFFAVIIMARLGIYYVSEQENEKTEVKIEVTAEQAGMRLSDFLAVRITRLDIFRHRMEQIPPLSEAEFRTTALRIQHELPGFQAVNWIDADGIFQWVTPLNNNLPVVGVDLQNQAAREAAEVFLRSMRYQVDTSTPLINLMQGGNGFAIYLPVVNGNNVSGFINGVFRIEELINTCFNNTIKDFNYRVMLSGERVYSRGEPQNFNNPQYTGRYNFTVLGQSWELEIVPGSSRGGTTQLMYALSFVVSVLIAMLVSGITFFKMKSNAELAKAYKIVESSEAKFRTIFDKSPACLIRYSPQAEMTDWNLEAASLFSLEFPPQAQRSIHDFQAMQPIMSAIEKTFAGETAIYRGFLEIQNRKIEIDANFEPLLSGSDTIQGGIILLKDVTEQNQIIRGKEVMYEISELTHQIQDLPLLFESIQQSLSKIIDARNFYVALYDEEFEEFRYPYYKDEFDSPPPEPQRGERGISAYTIKLGRPTLVGKEEFYTLHNEGKIELLGTPCEQWLGCPLIVENKPIGIMAVQSYSKDIIYQESDLEMLGFVSDQVALSIKIKIEDEKLRKSEVMYRELSKQLSDSNNMKALLLDVISHDLKNPAGVISGITELLTQGDDVSQEIQLIKDSSDILLKVLDNTTALAQITLGDEILMKEMNLSNLVNDIVAEFKPNFDSEQMPLRLEIDGDVKYFANPIIAEVFRNYLSNALKYAPQGQEVEVTLKKGTAQIEFCVSDLGTTITSENQEAIFKRSVQLEKGRIRGSGLGLAIVKQIAEVHGAQVGVKANTPTGNIFYLQLPLKSI